jgi:hypothetical protein
MGTHDVCTLLPALTLLSPVYIIFLVETVMTALNGVDVYHWFAAGFGDILEFAKPLISPA